MKQSRFTPGDTVQVIASAFFGPKWDALGLSYEVGAYEIYVVKEVMYDAHNEIYLVGLKGVEAYYPQDVLIKIVNIHNENKGEFHGEKESI